MVCQTRVNEFGSVLLGNEGGVANGPTSSVDWGDGLNFHEPKILTMNHQGLTSSSMWELLNEKFSLTSLRDGAEIGA